MKLSQFATLLEKTDKKQCKEHLYSDGHYCALGVAKYETENFDPIAFDILCHCVTGYSVTMMNDVFEWDFLQIATYIRAILTKRHNDSQRTRNLA